MFHVLTRDTFYTDLLEEIKRARKMVLMDAYIWVNDEVGRAIAEALLDLANRGGRIFLRKDLTASVFEHTPGRLPFCLKMEDFESTWRNVWNRRYSFLTPKNLNLMAFYGYGKKPRPTLKPSPLYEQLLDHPNVCLDHLPLFNHGKLILVDDIAFVGGQCISKDYTLWKDYNIKVKAEPFVRDVLYALVHGTTQRSFSEAFFLQNTFPLQTSIFHEMEQFIASVETGEELFIEMAYFGMWFLPIFTKALKRGVRIKILASKKSDTNQDTNMWFLATLLRLHYPNLEVYLSDVMIHTKGMVTRKKVFLGAANFHGASGFFKSLNEQNIYSEHPRLVSQVLKHFVHDFQESHPVSDPQDLPAWSKWGSYKERLMVFLTSYFIYFNKRKIQRYRDHANLRLRDLIVEFGS